MKKKLQAGIFLGISIGLVIMIILIGLLLGQKESQVTTIKKTKASAITYNKIVDLGQNPTGSVIFPTPTTVLLADANVSPTQPIMPTVTIQVTKAVTPTKTISLPVSGRSEYLIGLITVASIVIFFSLVF